MKMIAQHRNHAGQTLRLKRVLEQGGPCNHCYFLGRDCDAFIQANGFCEKTVWVLDVK